MKTLCFTWAGRFFFEKNFFSVKQHLTSLTFLSCKMQLQSKKKGNDLNDRIGFYLGHERFHGAFNR